MRPGMLAALFFLAGCLGYLGLSFWLFEMPADAEAAEHCGFLPSDFTSAGTLAYERSQAWWISFQRKEEIFSLLSVGLATGFAGFALKVGQGGAGALGGGLLVLSAICVSCLAPVLRSSALAWPPACSPACRKASFFSTRSCSPAGARFICPVAHRGAARCQRIANSPARRKKPDRS